VQKNNRKISFHLGTGLQQAYIKFHDRQDTTFMMFRWWWRWGTSP